MEPLMQPSTEPVMEPLMELSHLVEALRAEALDVALTDDGQMVVNLPSSRDQLILGPSRGRERTPAVLAAPYLPRDPYERVRLSGVAGHP
jgi:hypothetical protein